MAHWVGSEPPARLNRYEGLDAICTGNGITLEIAPMVNIWSLFLLQKGPSQSIYQLDHTVLLQLCLGGRDSKA